MAPVHAENRPPRVLIADPMGDGAAAILREAGFDVVERPDITPGQLIAAVRDCVALLVRSRTKVNAGVLGAGISLRVVGRAGAGVDNIDVGEASRRGIVVMNTPGANTVSTAEHAIAMTLALARNIPQADRSVRHGEWDRGRFIGTEITGKTMGIIGLGKVGREVASRSAGLGMRVIGYDPMLPEEAVRKTGAEPVPLPRLFGGSDFISVHTPLTPETRNLINRDTLALCKPGVRIINCARGGIVVEEALLAALDEGLVAGAALDVFETEPPRDTRLLTHERIIRTPHLGASTGEAQEKVAVQIAGQVVEFIMGRGVPGSVNADVISLAMKTELKPYLRLCEKMGAMLAQLNASAPASVLVSLRGRHHREAGDAILAAVLKGLLGPSLTDPVNYLNAAHLARSRGTEINVFHDSGEAPYPLLIRVDCTSGGSTRSVEGTVFGTDDIRITGIDGYSLEVMPEGNLLVYYNIDRPGMLARVSGILAESSVNIARLSLGRKDAGGRALTVIGTDQRLDARLLENIRSVEGISGIQSISLR